MYESFKKQISEILNQKKRNKIYFAFPFKITFLRSSVHTYTGPFLNEMIWLSISGTALKKKC